MKKPASRDWSGDLDRRSGYRESFDGGYEESAWIAFVSADFAVCEEFWRIFRPSAPSAGGSRTETFSGGYERRRSVSIPR